MTLHVYNGLSKEKEEFKPLDEDGNTVKMYVCGQTVYDYMHIGHARTYIAFDIIRRYLKHRGYAVKTVINITDVNDKINDRAELLSATAAEDWPDHFTQDAIDHFQQLKEENGVITPWDVADYFTAIKLREFDTLGIHADAYPKASEYVQDMIDMVQDLVDNGIGYDVDGDVFFDVRKFREYGQLSHQDLADIRPEREDDIVASDKKRHPEDFVLWKHRAADEDDVFTPTWDSPWGEGVPGWHIECSTMSTRLLGEQFDIHGGGADLVFPHHEDEIAQAEGATGKRPWVQYWLHAGLVRADKDKMSKSLGNVEPSQNADPEPLRLMVAGTHYRKPLDFSPEKLDEAEKNLQQLKNTVQDIEAELRATSEQQTAPHRLDADDTTFLDDVVAHRSAFMAAMDDDFNTPEALKHLYAVENAANTYLDSADQPKHSVLQRGLETFHELGDILGIFQERDTVSADTDSVLDATVEIREELRKQEQYDLADRIRDALNAAGIRLEDTERGARWKWT
jgi:cysteinyl-tRNA synthetase